MARAIKRAGVIFLALAIICLLAIGVLIGVSGAKNDANNSLDLSNKIGQASATVYDELPPIVEEVFLDGTTCEEQAAKWTEAIEKSRANGENKHILVTMKEDWIAPNSGTNNFGESSGFSHGAIFVRPDTTITLDLNGCTIDRKLDHAIEAGSVFIVHGTLTLKDSKYDSVAVQNAYNSNPASSGIVEVAKSNGAGCITGGYITGNGAAFLCTLSAKLYMYGGVICNNVATTYSGGMYVVQQASLKIYDGIIANNTANVGGGLLVRDNAQFSMYNGFIFNNRAINGSGGGINFKDLTTPTNIYGGVIAKNTALDDGGGILVSNSTLNMYGGILDRNIASGLNSSCGGAICGVSNSKLNISGVKVTYNEAGYLGGGLYNETTTGVMTIKDTFITGNKARKQEGVETNTPNGGGVYYGQSKLRLGAGCLIYTNYASGSLNNIPTTSANPIEIHENLLSGGKAFRVAVNANNGTVFTTGLKRYNTLLTPNQFFLADNNMTITADSNGEAIVGTTTNTAQSITWKWGTGSNQSALNYAEVPYTGQTYTLSAVITGTSTAVTIQPVPGTGTTSLSIREPGSYSFYTTGNYRASSFQIKILEPKEKITKPVQTEAVFLLNGKQQAYVPQGFDSSTMEIAYSRADKAGVYTASVKLKDAWNTTWADGSTGELNYTYSIIRDSVIGANSDYDYIYKDDENKRQNYSDNEIYHKYNDNVLNLVADNPRYVIGNITANTSVREFITNLKSEDITKVKLFDSNGTLIYNGTTQSSSYDIDATLVQTGWYLQYESYFANTETIYLSVLGDVIADGVINTLDVTFVNRIAKGEIKLEDLSIEQQLAAMVDNKGKVTSTDGKILLNVIGGSTETNSYFKNVAKKDKYQLWVLNNDIENSKTYRENINLTTLNIFDNAIIGNISPNTEASEFKTKLANQTSANISDIAIYKANGTIAADNDYIGTGCYITYNGKTIYLSVLGDLTGDGKVDTTDMTYLNRIVNGNINLNTNIMEQKLIMLAAIIQNKGNITTADSESIWNYIGGNIDMSKYF